MDLLKGQTRKHYTYSTIFDEILNAAQNNHINFKKLIIGIFACQEPLTIANDVNSHSILTRNKLTTRFLTLNEVNNGIRQNRRFNIFCFKVNPATNTTLGAPVPSITDKGCGLAMLSYYNIMEKNRAAGETICLPKTGTSIFKLIDYIINSNTNTIILPNTDGLFVLRCNLNIGLTYLFNEFNITNDQQRVVVIFKMYSDLHHKSNYSHVGHTVSFEKHNNNLTFIDAQKNVKQTIVSITHLNIYFNKHYNNFNYMDIIFYMIPILDDIKLNIQFPQPHEFVNQYDITFGGKSNKHNIYNKQKSNKRNIYNKRKSKKNQFGGGYIEEMKKIDSINGVKSVFLKKSQL
jgi:hypothetical protein